MADRPSGAAPSRLVAVLGPTNTGKTHLAVERMLGHASGMIGLPLRLLAREIYDRIVKLRGARAVALITGEEKIVPRDPHYFVCTVEAMPLNREVEFLAVDEIQLCADPARGHVFTHRLLNARGRSETMFLGSLTMAPLIRRLLPQAEFVTRERFSRLSYAGSKKLTRLPRRSAVVAFSAENVYAIAELIRRQRGGAAVVMGSLSPRTRNAQVALYQSGEVDFLVATDAIGMGLNMDVDHVAFAGLRKFDGKRTRWLHPPEVGQIAGRAGRYRTDGTFGVTGEAPEMDEDLVQAVEAHRFEPLAAAEWRSAALDFTALKGLIRSLAAPPSLVMPTRDGLKLAEESLDETTLHQLAQDPELDARVGRNRALIRRLWEVSQTPDFRKTTLDEHVRLCRTVFDHLTSGDERLPEDWVAGQFAVLDHVEGDIESLAQRLAGVRTLAYVANRPDWVRDPAHWQGRTRGLEDRLSDVLHEKLMARFIDRRTSALLRGLHQHDEVLAGVAADGAVTVEGHYVGRLKGLRFDPAQGASQLEDKALRAAAQKAVAPEVARRLGALASAEDGQFTLLPDGLIAWRGEAAGKLVGGGPFAPRVRLFGELGPEPARERAKRRLEAFLAGEASRTLVPLRRLEDALAEGDLRGLARGIAYRLAESGGVLARQAVAAEVQALSQSERRTLRGLGVRFGEFALYLPALLGPEPRALLAAFAEVETPGWRPPLDRPSLERPGAALSPARSAPSPRTLGWRGLAACGGLVAPVEALERLGTLLRASPRRAGGVALSDAALATLGWDPALAAALLRALGYVRARRSAPIESMPVETVSAETVAAETGAAESLAAETGAAEAGDAAVTIWRRRRPAPQAAPTGSELTPAEPSRPPPDAGRAVEGRPAAASPFAALAALQLAPAAPVLRGRRRRRPRAAGAA